MKVLIIMKLGQSDDERVRMQMKVLIIMKVGEHDDEVVTMQMKVLTSMKLAQSPDETVRERGRKLIPSEEASRGLLYHHETYYVIMELVTRQDVQ